VLKVKKLICRGESDSLDIAGCGAKPDKKKTKEIKQNILDKKAIVFNKIFII